MYIAKELAKHKRLACSLSRTLMKYIVVFVSGLLMRILVKILE